MEIMAISPESKMRSPDRVLVLNVIDPKERTGLIDPQVFTGNNPLHAKRDDQAGLWYLQYEHGILPESLKQRFTSFKALLKYASDEFKKRNIAIKEVKD